MACGSSACAAYRPPSTGPPDRCPGEAEIDFEENEEIQIFRQYLRIVTVQPDVNYDEAVEFIQERACEMDLPCEIYFPFDEKNPVVVITWEGTHPKLPSIMLNSHMDVVPVFEDHWVHKPFEADMDDDGKIYGRGTQDMKSIGMQYVAAVRALKKAGCRLKRTIHITFMPDEEMGGTKGMKAFVQTDSFKELNVGFALDEGLATPTDCIPVFYAERSVWRVTFTITGCGGHASLLLQNTASQKLLQILGKMTDLRNREISRLSCDPHLTIGDITTINLTRINGGTQSNVIPSQISVCYDVRISLSVDQTKFEELLNKLAADVGEGITVEFEQKRPRTEPTPTDETNVYWSSFKCAMDEMALKYKLHVFTGGTDSRYLREVGIPALGFSPMCFTEVRLHSHNEYIHAQTYLSGIEIYKQLITKLGNASKCNCKFPQGKLRVAGKGKKEKAAAAVDPKNVFKSGPCKLKKGEKPPYMEDEEENQENKENAAETPRESAEPIVELPAEPVEEA